MSAKVENDSVVNQESQLTEASLIKIKTYSFVGFYSISNDFLVISHKLHDEVLLDEKRLYLVMKAMFDGKEYLFAAPFRTNIPKNQNPYKALPKMSGTGNTRKGCTHGVHIAKTIPVRRKYLLKSRHAKKYKGLVQDGTINILMNDVIKWIDIFDEATKTEEYTPYFYSVKLKKLLKAVNN